MMIKTLCLITAFLLGQALACEIQLPHNLLILGDNPDLTQALHQTECSTEAIKNVSETLSQVEGKITSQQLGEILKSKGHDTKVAPNFIQVQHIRNLVREQLMTPPGVQLRSSEAFNAQNFVALEPGDRVELQCPSCLFGSQQTLNLNIRGFDGNQRSLMVKADFKKMVKAYRMLSTQAAFSEISPASLKEEFIESIPQTDLVTDLTTLRFYKLNKPIRQGEFLRQSDLNGLNLVRAGVSTEVIIENELIRIKTSGISRSNGTLGEFVEVFHPQKNKKYQGKVVDINKVLVEL